MPSPFPGMDPYLEDPEIWSDFHNNLASELQAQLNARIQPRYVARLVPRVTYEVVAIGQMRGVRPDVGVWRSHKAEAPPAMLDYLIPPAPVESLVELEFPLQLAGIEIYATSVMELVTAIEILSPVNKRPGHEAHRDYLHKRRELLRASVHLVEIDLLRGGERPPLVADVPAAPYYVLVSRWERRPTVEVWPIQLWDTLPTIPAPLLAPDPDAPLSLGAALDAIYQRGGYGTLIDYRRPPPLPELALPEQVWLDEWLRTRENREEADRG